MESTLHHMSDMERHPSLPRPFGARPATMDDLPAAVELHELNEREVIGQTTGFGQRFNIFWTMPDTTVGDDIRVVESPEGDVVGCAHVWVEPPYVQAKILGNVRPDHYDRGIGSYLMQWGEQRAREVTARAPDDARLSLQNWVLAGDKRSVALCRDHGLAVARHLVFMRIDFDGPPAPPVWPEGVEIRPVTLAEHGRAISDADEEIFRDHWGFAPKTEDEAWERFKHWVENDPDFDENLWFVAFCGDEVAGLSLCWPKAEENPDGGYIGILGVRRPWRGKGLGLALLRHSFVEFHRLGRKHAALHADAENITGALRLYTNAGMRIERQTDLFEKELRPGRELATRTLED
ncbi:MAG: GNAT family N-acetyltransferase [Planctomycetota bacterium]